MAYAEVIQIDPGRAVIALNRGHLRPIGRRLRTAKMRHRAFPGSSPAIASGWDSTPGPGRLLTTKTFGLISAERNAT